MKKTIDNGCTMPYNNHCCAGVAHLVERDLAKVEVASSSLVARSKNKILIRQDGDFIFGTQGRGSKRARAEREKHAGGMFRCPCACGGAKAPPASLVAMPEELQAYAQPMREIFRDLQEKYPWVTVTYR